MSEGAKDADVDRLTPEQIEAKRSAIQAAIALVEGMSQHWMEERWKAANDLCDLALQSLSQEAVREEALEEAAKRCEAAIAELDITDDVLKIDDYFKGFKAAVEARARAIRALKREPNAAAQDRSTERASGERTSAGTSPSPAPAAPDVASMVKHDWVERADNHGVYDCANCTSWTANLPLYKDEVCEAKERRFTDRRKARSLR